MKPEHYSKLKERSRKVATYGNTEILRDEEDELHVIHVLQPKEEGGELQIAELLKTDDLHDATMAAAQKDQSECAT